MFDSLFNLIKTQGYRITVHRIVKRLERSAISKYQHYSALFKGSHCRSPNEIGLRSRLSEFELSSLGESVCIPRVVAEHYLSHRFDLLGSGWTKVKYGANCRGLEGNRFVMSKAIDPDNEGKWLKGRINQSNLKFSQIVWKQIDSVYQPIDWQLDFKSGFRWSESAWSKNLKYAHLEGVDVKVPWELARMQHLPQMALRAKAVVGDDTDEAHRLYREMRNQILDFIATNPPGFGVNWICPMDVAIRAANWVLAWDVFRASGFVLCAEESEYFSQSVYEHGRYISQNLEWYPNRANHYLSHVCGLAFIASYLAENNETNGWLRFSIDQLSVETLRQFHPDGGNFEGSTAYHRLSSEMVLYTFALIMGIPEFRIKKVLCIPLGDLKFVSKSQRVSMAVTEVANRAKQGEDGKASSSPFGPAFYSRLHALVAFFRGILKPDGSFPQIGDNDGGRFFKIQPSYTQRSVSEAKTKYSNLNGYVELPDSDIYFMEEWLNGKHLINVASAIGIVPERDEMGSILEEQNSAEGIVVRALTGGKKLPDWDQEMESYAGAKNLSSPEKTFDFLRSWERMLANIETHSVLTYDVPFLGRGGSQNITCLGYPDFGCFLIKNSHFYLLIRCLIKNSDVPRGHMHYDQLTIDFENDGEPVLRNLGTYIYTPLPKERILYREAKAIIRPDKVFSTSNLKRPNVFCNIDLPLADIEYFGEFGFCAFLKPSMNGMGLIIKIDESKVHILYVGTAFMGNSVEGSLTSIAYSPSYGIKESGKK